MSSNGVQFKPQPRNGPDFSGTGNCQIEDNNTNFSDSLWQIGEGIRYIKSKVSKKTEQMSEKIKQYLDEM